MATLDLETRIVRMLTALGISVATVLVCQSMNQSFLATFALALTFGGVPLMVMVAPTDPASEVPIFAILGWVLISGFFTLFLWVATQIPVWTGQPDAFPPVYGLSMVLMALIVLWFLRMVFYLDFVNPIAPWILAIAGLILVWLFMLVFYGGAMNYKNLDPIVVSTVVLAAAMVIPELVGIDFDRRNWRES